MPSIFRIIKKIYTMKKERLYCASYKKPSVLGEVEFQSNSILMQSVSDAINTSGGVVSAGQQVEEIPGTELDDNWGE